MNVTVTRTACFAALFAFSLITLVGCDRGQDDPAMQSNTSVKMSQEKPEIRKTITGSYLAARFAIARDDFHTANDQYRFITDTLSKNTPEAAAMIDRALPAAIGAGDIQRAIKLAKKIDLSQPSATAQLAVTTLLADAFRQQDEKAISALLVQLKDDGFGRLLKPLLAVWYDAEKNDHAAAEAKIAVLSQRMPSLRPLLIMQNALLADYAQNKEKAEKLYDQTLDSYLSVRSVWMASTFYKRIGQPEKAKQAYARLIDKMPNSPWPRLMLARLDDSALAEPITPAAGVAGVFYDVASILNQDGSSRLGLLYAQLARHLSDEDPFLQMLLGDILAEASTSDLAEEAYLSVDKDSALYPLAQFRLAEYYERIEKYDEAIAILTKLSHDEVLKKQAYTQIADLYRRQENFKKAIPFYNKVLEGEKGDDKEAWSLYYARGISLEREGYWEKAEADLKKALELSPDQPEVLNYLAYSWADHGQNLEKALEMLEKALEGAPNDPYISDSVGWALYKLGRYEEALPFIEASAESLPDDPTINDHLGDVYWRVGRTIEARFQWQRALKFASDNDVKLKESLRKKLADGLPKADAKKIDVNKENAPSSPSEPSDNN